jgi:2-polyprenyl-3-methyl-5-hydroxy-6-metoxy-1,4-benzoquinol methylase
MAMPLLSEYVRTKKVEYFLNRIPKQCNVLEIGCGSCWIREYMKQNGWSNYVGLDVIPPADIIGDIKDKDGLGLKEDSFDYVIAFEVVEHIDCFKECYDILKPGGQLMITTPLPHMDWALKLLELMGLNQKRTSAHSNLTYLKDVPFFTNKDIKVIGFASQWGILTK